MSVDDLITLEARYAMPTYARAPVEFVRGQGARLWDAEGNEYLDFFAGLSVHNAATATGDRRRDPRPASAWGGCIRLGDWWRRPVLAGAWLQRIAGWNYGNREALGEELPPFAQTTAIALIEFLRSRPR